MALTSDHSWMVGTATVAMVVAIGVHVYGTTHWSGAEIVDQCRQAVIDDATTHGVTPPTKETITARMVTDLNVCPNVDPAKLEQAFREHQ